MKTGRLKSTLLENSEIGVSDQQVVSRPQLLEAFRGHTVPQRSAVRSRTQDPWMPKCRGLVVPK